MAIDQQTRSEILRLHRAEGWPVGTIARHLGIHHSTVRRALGGAGVPRRSRTKMIDPYIPFITEQFEKEPGLSARVLHEQVRQRGYTGGLDHFRHLLRDLGLRPQKKPEASMRLNFLPAEQAQVDWVDLGRVTIGRAERKLMGFVMTLSYSRCSYLRLSYTADMSAFLAGHVAAFEAFGGVPRSLLYDNLKSVVTARRGPAITYNPTFLAFAGHYAFEAPVTWPRRPQEKGRVERNIRYVRSAFMAGRDINTPLDQLNADALEWCFGPALERPWPQDDDITVGDAFARERELLVPLPDVPFPTDEICPVRIGKTPYARFDTNDYSVPHKHVGATLTVVASPERVRILDGEREVAAHKRSWDSKRQIDDPEHVKALIASKRHGRAMGTRDRLIRAVPRAQDLLAAAGARNDNVATIARTLTRLLDSHGADELDRAIARALERGSPHPNTVIRILETDRGAGRLPPELGADAADPGITTPRATGLEAYERAMKNRKKGKPE